MIRCSKTSNVQKKRIFGKVIQKNTQSSSISISNRRITEVYQQSKPICYETSNSSSLVKLDYFRSMNKENEDNNRFHVVPSSIEDYSLAVHTIMEEHKVSLLEREKEYSPQKDYYSLQPYISADMRCTLVDWMTEVCEAYYLHRETLYYAVNYVDRYLSNSPKLPREKFQLLGVSSLMLASKIEEIRPPSAKDYSRLTEDSYSVSEILQMEKALLKVHLLFSIVDEVISKSLQVLNWKLLPPTPSSWMSYYICRLHEQLYSNEFRCEILHHIIKLDPLLERLYRQSMWLLDLTFLSIDAVKYSLECLVASALISASYDSKIIHKKVEECSSVSLEMLQKCIMWMRPLVKLLPVGNPGDPKSYRINKEVPLENQYMLQTYIPGSAVAVQQLNDTQYNSINTKVDEREIRDAHVCFSNLSMQSTSEFPTPSSSTNDKEITQYEEVQLTEPDFEDDILDLQTEEILDVHSL